MMQEGLLWFCDDPKMSLANKVLCAARAHLNKYGETANTCYVHPSQMPRGELSGVVGNIRVLPRKTTPIHHFWVGIED